uniref:Uncharacterized protein n=1 Tax=Oryza punctata TaxID=4537 RepID=A0A0E0LG93_ORYPU
MRRHIHDGDPKAVVADKLRKAAENYGKRDLVRESTESLILDRQKKIGAYNMRNVWLAGGVALAGYLVGKTAGTFYARMEGEDLVQKIKGAMFR